MTSANHLDVLVMGEALVDIVTANDATQETPGGSPMNVAFGLARLGASTMLATSLADDERGRMIATHLGTAGVLLSPHSITTEKTSSASVRLGPEGDAEYDFDLRWVLDETVDSLPVASIVHTGSIGAFLEPGADAVLKILGGRRDSSLIGFDPNIRADLLGDPAGVRERFVTLAGTTDVLKLSIEDAAWLYPGVALDELLDILVALGPSIVVVTLGSDGAALATPADRVTVPGRAVTVVDTIGAGDSFMSALLWRVLLLVREEDVAALRTGEALSAEVLRAIGEFAIACSAITVTRAGADPPTADEVR
jgi:fructokinase